MLAVWTIAQRGAGLIEMASPPVFTDLADSVFDQDAAFSTSNLVALSRNAKRSVVATEAFYDAGGALSTMTLAVGGSAYLVGEILTLKQGSASAGKVQVTSIGSGGGVIQEMTVTRIGIAFVVLDIPHCIARGAWARPSQVTSCRWRWGVAIGHRAC